MSDDTLLPSEPSGQPSDTPSEPKANFYWKEGLAGEGDAPDWYKGDKYKSVSDQAKAYTDLEKKFGGFKGAPESYDLPEEIDSEANYVQMLSEIGQKTNMNQDTFSELLELGEALLSGKIDLDKEAELNALGDDAESRIGSVDAFLRNNLGDKYDYHKDAVNSAKTVELVESLIKATAPSKLPTDPEPTVKPVTQDDIEAMMTAKDENGHVKYETSEAYREKVYQAIARMNGEEYVPNKHVNYS